MLRLLHLAVPILLMIPSTGMWARAVVSVSVTTPPVVVGETETITVVLTAPCSGVTIDFGDGQTQSYPATPPKLDVFYAWTTTGAKTVKATGINNCTGQASTTVNVQSGGNPLGDLCKVVDCGELADMFKPKITGILAVNKPGGTGFIKGKNFGTSKESVVANLVRPNGSAQPEQLEVANWTPTLIEINWPENISGVMDQDTTVHVVTSNQVKTNAWPILFRAAVTSTEFPFDELTQIDCGTDSNSDICGTEIDEGDFDGIFDFNPFRGPCSGTICGSHENVWAAIGDDKDNDVFGLPSLKNGWEYDGFEKLKWNTSGGSLSGPTGLVSNSSAGQTLTVKWMVTPNDDVEYDVAVRIRGPVGVPHK